MNKKLKNEITVMKFKENTNNLIVSSRYDALLK